VSAIDISSFSTC